MVMSIRIALATVSAPFAVFIPLPILLSIFILLKISIGINNEEYRRMEPSSALMTWGSEGHTRFSTL